MTTTTDFKSGEEKHMEEVRETKAPATDTSAPTDIDEAEYRDAVERGKAACASVSEKQWELGDLAATVTKVYGENRLERFAEDINFPGAPCTLGRYRSVCLAFPKTGGRPRFFASAQILQKAAHDDTIQKIVTANPNISASEARELMRKRRAEQAGATTPTEQPDAALPHHAHATQDPLQGNRA